MSEPCAFENAAEASTWRQLVRQSGAHTLAVIEGLERPWVCPGIPARVVDEKNRSRAGAAAKARAAAVSIAIAALFG